MSSDKVATIEEALDAARKATGNTLLVLTSPRQAERLHVAMQLADKMATGDLDGCTTLLVRYVELGEKI